jgi:hypothetical protein
VLDAESFHSIVQSTTVVTSSSHSASSSR